MSWPVSPAGLRSLLAALLMAAILMAVALADCCRAQSAAAPPQLTGDWFGYRSALAETGVTVYVDSTNFFFGNTAGGVQQDFDFSGHDDYILNLDGGRLLGRDGLFVKLKAEHRYGETITNDVGAFFSQTISADLPIAGSNQVYLTKVLLTQMIGDSWAVYAGKLDTLDGDANAFATGRGKTQFSNLGFVFNPAAAATVPYATLGAGVLHLVDGQQVFSFNVLNSVDTTGTSGFSELFNDGVLLTSDLRLPTNFFDRPGHQYFGGTWNNRTYSSLSDAYFDYPNIVIPTTRGSWSLYWNFDQFLVVDLDDSSRGWGAFGRAGLADDNTSPLSWFLSVGLGGASPLASRPADTFGIGWYYAATSRQISPLLTTTTGSLGDGQTVECFYNAQLIPGLRLTPDLQIIIPARETLDAALVFGLRGQFIF